MRSWGQADHQDFLSQNKAKMKMFQCFVPKNQNLNCVYLSTTTTSKVLLVGGHRNNFFVIGFQDKVFQFSRSEAETMPLFPAVKAVGSPWSPLLLLLLPLLLLEASALVGLDVQCQVLWASSVDYQVCFRIFKLIKVIHSPAISYESHNYLLHNLAVVLDTRQPPFRC